MSPEPIRRPLPHPGRRGTKVAFFADTGRALKHLGDHVLTAPECEAWGVIVPELFTHVDLASLAQRQRFCQEACAVGGASAGAVLDLYRAAAEAAVTHAFFLAWHVSEGETTVALGTTGVLVMITGLAVVTVYIPGQGSAEAVRNDRSAIPGRLGRERGRMRRWRLPPQVAPPCRPGAPPSEEYLYHRVFWPVVQFLKGQYHQAYTLDGQVRSHGPLVVRALPPPNELTLSCWQTYRGQVGAGGTS